MIYPIDHLHSDYLIDIIPIMRKELIVGADLHTHNWYSPDSPANPADIVKRCIATNIHYLAVTNHNTIEGAKETQEIAREQGADLIVIPGEEITLGVRNSAGKRVELLAYFLQETIPANLSIEEALKEIKKQCAIVGVPHPFELWRHGAGTELGEQVVRQSQEQGIPVLWEIFNSRATSSHNADSLTFFRFSDGYLKDSGGLLRSAGSDAHYPQEIGRGRILLIRWPENTQEELKEGFLESLNCSIRTTGSDNLLKTVYYRTLTRGSNLIQKHLAHR